MRAKVIEESRARPRNFTPPVADVGPITIDAGFEQNDASGEILAYRVLYGEKIAVPAPVLEHGEHDVLLPRDSGEMSRLPDRNCEWLVDHDIASGTHRQLRERRVRFVGARDYDEVDIRMRRERFWIGHDLDIRKDARHISGTAG